MPKLAMEYAQQILADVPGDWTFYCADGRVAHNLEDLANALANMSDETFAYHSNSEKGDFSTWVREAVGDDKLANDLRKASSRYRAEKAVLRRIAFLKEKLSNSESIV